MSFNGSRRNLRRFSAFLGAFAYFNSLFAVPAQRQNNVFDVIEEHFEKEVVTSIAFKGLLKSIRNSEYVNQVLKSGHYNIEDVTCPLTLVKVYDEESRYDRTGGYSLPEYFDPYCIDRTKQHVGIIPWREEEGIVWASAEGGFLDGYIGLRTDFRDFLCVCDDLLYDIMDFDADLTRRVREADSYVILPKGYVLCGFKRAQGMMSFIIEPAVFEEYKSSGLEIGEDVIYSKEVLNNPDLTYVGVSEEIVDVIRAGQILEGQLQIVYLNQDNPHR